MNKSLLISITRYLALALCLVACGSALEEEHVLDYRVYVLDRDYNFTMMQLIQSFNEQSGFQALTLVDDPAQANSTIDIIAGLEARDGKVGWGQWLTYKEEDIESPLLDKETTFRTIHYAMKLEFDKAFVDKQLTLSPYSPNEALQVLFNHEVGHGLKMEHTPDTSDMMFADISGTKNFPKFFEQVRAFFR